MLELADEKAQNVVPFILDKLDIHRQKYAHLPPLTKAPPLFLGVNGVQGAGKTILVSTLCKTLESEPHFLPTVVFSADDLYLTHQNQVELAASHSDNELVQHRGVPSTHDIPLAVTLVNSLFQRATTRVPSYDKSAFHGQGDRTDPDTWEEVNRPGEKSIDVVIFEGWCVGFKALDDGELRRKWEESCRERNEDSRLWRHGFEHLRFINDALKAYDALTDRLDAIVHIDAEDPLSVYEWRLEQEVTLRKTKGVGMTDAQVRRFVDGYYPAYELYTERLRQGVTKGREPGAVSARCTQLRLVVGKDRRVLKVERL